MMSIILVLNKAFIGNNTHTDTHYICKAAAGALRL